MTLVYIWSNISTYTFHFQQNFLLIIHTYSRYFRRIFFDTLYRQILPNITPHQHVCCEYLNGNNTQNSIQNYYRCVVRKTYLYNLYIIYCGKRPYFLLILSHLVYGVQILFGYFLSFKKMKYLIDKEAIQLNQLFFL